MKRSVKDFRMSRLLRPNFRVVAGIAVILASFAAYSARMAADMHAPIPPVNDLPNPYETISDSLKMPEGRSWGSTAGIALDKDGHSVWVAERCGDGCIDRTTHDIKPDVDSVLKFDAKGNLVKSFGAGMLAQPHGIFVDSNGNVWVTDGGDNAPPPPPGTRGGRRTASPDATKGDQVYEFSPDGKLLMTLGKPGGADAPGYFYQPNAVLVAPDGDIFVGEGHTESGVADHPSRMLKFDKTGKFLMTWGKVGSGDGDFDEPHTLAMDSKGRLFVGDRNNNRLCIFDQNGKFLEAWYQFGRPSGVYIDKNDMIYVADSETGTLVDHNHSVDGWKRGIRIGSVKDGKPMYFIPEPSVMTTPPSVGTSGAEGIVADVDGVVYGAEVTQKDVKKYVKK